MTDPTTLLISAGGALITLIAWLWRHSSRLTVVEVKLDSMQHRIDTYTQDVTQRLASIENKLDRVIERELGERRDGER